MLFLIAGLLGHRFDIGRKLDLDLRGQRIHGKVESRSDVGVRLSYAHPSGAIYARTLDSPDLGVQRSQSPQGEIQMVYDPQNPRRFQPAGLSYKPAGLVGALFFLGMACLLHARRLFLGTVRENRP
jgi:hypothetical protein